jgi:hypothetical protein
MTQTTPAQERYTASRVQIHSVRGSIGSAKATSRIDRGQARTNTSNDCAAPHATGSSPNGKGR